MNQRTDLVDDDAGLERGAFGRAQRDPMLRSLTGNVPRQNAAVQQQQFARCASAVERLGKAPEDLDGIDVCTRH
jgi:hypothetical protein